MERLIEDKNEVFTNPYPASFFAFEGIDFCGKSTQMARAANYLRVQFQKKCNVVLTKEPTNEPPFGKKIREILADKDLFAATHRLELQMLFAKDSRYHCENVILPVLARGDIVLTDRFRHSSCVYGAQKWNFLEIHMLMGMNQGCLGEYFVWPDCSFIFDLPAEIAFFRGLERAKKTGQKLDEMEKMETMERVKNNFYLFAQIYPDCHIIDADRTEEEIFVDVRNLLNETLIKKGWMQK
ncbi:MAG: dTMP kinase [Candidatus Yanofskybacteria bacterium RIFCSPHIGHO2_01_FULL_41_27]|uniref:Thymidylate kinase n=3 Tax=Candidatus Yanofskyibacteriota TaxID=1752733 RepID=A0A1F8HUF1_9BACT|nr:MAG: hypothetical protein UU84_C0032G0008 [Candidatus Yanofskybacteria bacterium GW2011_GWC2_41_9]OGM98796.1 MAG: dTMP kinase [Candidatus Yanofskybacteria bacterium RIFCSPHIGHO2_01_FULL_41_27]OGN08889.1 MAG: dTMP kinase [Candidatus Yanofskybacteria bacterium RIFCSPHIGHO2_02_FULL_41_12]OGN20786.1 MAG: dTMP kinase [Candidatus Yanofskybacteria bacterium RIFCSPLOWO2_01_FULL_41_33]OGN41215.1 MAG: dTMP kinase [Candidatus Yanofskybacteria bacterium RIFOXYD1_FULL_42_10]